MVLLDREQGGKENIRAQNIEPHVLFNISEAFEWMRQVALLDEEHYNVIREYMEEEKESMAKSDDS